jgi:mannitol-1-phosphate 5-dehydrogenase
MKAVHFGAGNIGRGFIGALLQDAGYHVVFADVNQELLDQLTSKGHYELIEVGEGGRRIDYSNYSCVNSVTDSEKLIEELSNADVITASVGANILPRIAPAIARGLEARTSSQKVIVMACENAVNASDALAVEVSKLTSDTSRAIFCNTAVDRIVPIQSGDISPSVEVEAFSELVIEDKNLLGEKLDIPGAKLYTVNTGHCATAYLGQLAGYETIASALKDKKVHDGVLDTLKETSLALVLKHGLDPAEQAKYVAKTLGRLQNPMIDDSVERVGRDPIRKLSRTERLVGPAAFLAEQGQEPKALLEVISAALDFHNDEDPQVAQLQQNLNELSPEEFVALVCGLETTHPLARSVTQIVRNHKNIKAGI